MNGKEGRLGKLILLRQAREEAGRRALEQARAAEARAEAAHREAAARRDAATEALAHTRQAPCGEDPPAQVLQFRSRWSRMMEQWVAATEAMMVEVRADRIAQAEAVQRRCAELVTSSDEGRRLVERLKAERRAHGRRRERAAERARDDLPRRGEDGDPGGDGAA
jgi:hypothetical protein